MTPPPLVVYVDVDETLIRNAGRARIPIPAATGHVRELAAQGADLYCWSSGGAAYARDSAREVGLEDVFTAFLPKPQVLLDDQPVGTWRRLVQVHPLSCSDETVNTYRAALSRGRPEP
ncbi:hypothetical protein HNQ07_002558 [Deinococcus metalli]|uniref:DUF705 domain-containing protein n=1 Tax=Deinococcus metalli TaxID=1141878 RepID=A0A7W8KFR3_9DEIO|nr:DUF705 domain-containing protein [Deinococcus metalli]MBB5377085.1 hypothetical protein [Deinococcus metalli]GHF49110.1 hypothetical protein GCM10017781_26900 [Deinococcus metalli]